MKGKHPVLTPFLYAIPAVPMASLGILFFVYLPKFHAEEAGVSLGFLSLILFVSRLWDAFSDPLIGHWSDSITTSPFKRRALWMLCAVIPLAGSFLLLSSSSMLQSSPEISIAIATIIFFTALTGVVVPYESWALELGEDLKLRDRAILFREAATLIGTIFAGGIPLVFASYSSSAAEQFSLIGIFLSIFLVLSTFIMLLYTPPPVIPAVIKHTSLIQSVKDAAKNRNFMLLLLSFSFSTIASQIPAALILFFVSDVIESESSGIFVLLYFVAAGFGFPFWYWCISFVSKRDLWICGLLVNTVSFLFVSYLQAGDLYLYGACVLFSGFGVGAILAVPPLLQADVIQADTEEFGTKREGTFVALWSIVRKSSAAIAASAALWCVSFFGYDPSIDNTYEALNGLTLTYCIIPCLFNLMAILTVLSLKEKPVR